MTSFKSSNPASDRLISYRDLYLSKVSGGRDRESTWEPCRNLKGMDLTMKEHRFLGEDPILVLEFLSRMAEECDILGFIEAQIKRVIPQFLTGKAEKKFRPTRNGARSGGVSCWHEAVLSFLRTKYRPETIPEAVNRLSGTRKLVHESEQD